MLDPLKDLESSIISTAQGKNLVVFKAEDLLFLWDYPRETDSNKSNVVEFCGEEGWEAFLNIAKTLEAQALYFHAKNFSFEDFFSQVNDSISQCRDAGQLKKQGQVFRKYDGFIEHLILAFFINGVWHSFQITSDWSLQCLQFLGKLEDLEEEEDKGLSDDELDSLAKKMANNPAFEKIKFKGDQKVLVRKLLSKENPKALDELDEILARARVIFQTEVNTKEKPRTIGS